MLTDAQGGGGGHLPGGHTVGALLFFSGSSVLYDDGDRLTHGQQGEVVGPATVEAHKGKGLAMQFPGNEAIIDCPLTRLSATAPPSLPGGHTVGQLLFLTGWGHAFADGGRLMHGQQGEVVGPAEFEPHKGTGIAMRFQGNSQSILDCPLTWLSVSAPPPLLPDGDELGLLLRDAEECVSRRWELHVEANPLLRDAEECVSRRWELHVEANHSVVTAAQRAAVKKAGEQAAEDLLREEEEEKEGALQSEKSQMKANDSVVTAAERVAAACDSVVTAAERVAAEKAAERAAEELLREEEEEKSAMQSKKSKRKAKKKKPPASSEKVADNRNALAQEAEANAVVEAEVEAEAVAERAASGASVLLDLALLTLHLRQAATETEVECSDEVETTIVECSDEVMTEPKLDGSVVARADESDRYRGSSSSQTSASPSPPKDNAKKKGSKSRAFAAEVGRVGPVPGETQTARLRRAQKEAAKRMQALAATSANPDASSSRTTAKASDLTAQAAEAAREARERMEAAEAAEVAAVAAMAEMAERERIEVAQVAAIAEAVQHAAAADAQRVAREAHEAAERLREDEETQLAIRRVAEAIKQAADMPSPTPAVVSLADAHFEARRPDAPESTVGGETTCIICFSDLKSHLAYPCGHRCACAGCAAQMTQCPVCREPVVTWVHVRDA